MGLSELFLAVPSENRERVASEVDFLRELMSDYAIRLASSLVSSVAAAR
jgi:hypothetical protein